MQTILLFLLSALFFFLWYKVSNNYDADEPELTIEEKQDILEKQTKGLK